MKKPKILLYDIETSPNVAYVWGHWEQNVLAYKEQWQMLSFAWKWLGEKEIHYDCVPRSLKEKGLVKRLGRLIAKADVVIAHNGDTFDIKKVRTRLLYHKLPMLPPVASVDTLKVARKYFAFNSNKLNDLAQFLGLGEKVKHEGIDFWLDYIRGDTRARALMEKYNKQDVNLLEKVYLRMLPAIENHPRMANHGQCLYCGGKRVQSRGLVRTARKVYRRLQCQDCLKWFRGG